MVLSKALSIAKCVLLIVSAGLILSSCGGNDLSQIHAISAKIAAAPVEKSYDVVITYSDSARVKVVLKTPYILQFHTAKPYEEMPRGVHIDFYNAVGLIESKLDSKYAIRYDLEKKVMVQNDVRVVNKKGETLNTEQLWWDESHKKIYTDKFVRYTKSDGTYEGDGLDADETFTRILFRRFRGKVLMGTDSL